MKSVIGEQLTRKYVKATRGVIRWWKRRSSKARRRQERADVEGAPKQNRYRGYFD